MDVSKADAITDFDGSDIGSNLRDNANSLVAKGNMEWQCMFICAAEARVSDFDDGVVSANFATGYGLVNGPVL